MSAANRIPISVRISQEDADFIANLEIEGANTPSEKIRELLKEARLAHAQTQDYESTLIRCEQLIQPAKHDLLLLEKNLGVHSPIMARAFELVPDLMATLAAVPDNDCNITDLKKHERELMWRIVRLMDGVLQLAITGKAAAYDDGVLSELANTLILAEIINGTQKSLKHSIKKGENHE